MIDDEAEDDYKPGANLDPHAASKFTPQTEKVIIKVISRGGPKTLAALAAGISVQTLRRWIREGKKAEEEGDLDNEKAIFVSKLNRAILKRTMKYLAVSDRLLEGTGPAASAAQRQLEFMMTHGDFSEHFKSADQQALSNAGVVRVTSIEYVALPPPSPEDPDIIIEHLPDGPD